MQLSQPIDLSQGPVALGRYVLLSLLGRGGMSVVYSAYDEALDRKVAIKVLRAGDQLGRLRLRREAQALAQLTHPNIVRVYEIGELDELDYIAMELVDGVTLQVWREQIERTLTEILSVYLAAGRGLAAAHAKGIVHRDFKPENAMIRGDGQVLVMDFGLARDGRDELAELDPDEPPSTDRIELPEGRPRSSVRTLTRVGAVMGTLGYMAPEQVLGRLADARSDQFSFCVSVWEAIHGQRPFPATNIASYRKAVLDGRPRVPTNNPAPPWLRAVLERGMALDPADRWPSIDALLDALADDPRRSRRRWLIGVGGIALAAATAAGSWGVDQRTRARQIVACEAERATVDRLWSLDRATALERRFEASSDPLAASAWAATRPWLDAFAEQLGRLRAENCRASTLDETRSELTAAQVATCLDDGEARFEALLAVLGEATPAVIEHAAEAAASLPLLAECSDERKQARLLRPPAPMKDQLHTIERQLHRVEALAWTGDYAIALAEAERAWREAEALEWPPAITEALLLESRLYWHTDARDQAVQSSERAFRIAAIAGDSIGMLAAAIERTRLAGIQNQFEVADAWRETTEALLVSTGLDAGPFAGELATIRASFEYARGNAEASQREARRAVEIFEATFGPDHPRVAEPLSTLGHALDLQSRRDESRLLYERTLAILLRAYGPDHPRLIDAYNDIGGSHHTADRGEQARDYYLRALAVQERTLGLDHSRAAAMLGNLGLLALEFENELPRAREYFERSATIYEAHNGPTHVSLLKPLLNLGIIASRLGQHEAAIEHLARAVQILELTAQGDVDPRAIWVRASVADAHVRRGDFAAAVPEYQHALAVAEQVHGAEHGQVVRPLLGLAECQIGLDQLEQARATLARVEPLLKEQPGRRWVFELANAKLDWATGEREQALAAILELRGRERERGQVLAVSDIDRWLARHAPEHAGGQGPTQQ